MGVIDLDARVKKLEQNAGNGQEIDQIEAALTTLEETVEGIGTYSTTEVAIGKWIDNSVLYRKVIPLTNIKIDSNHQAGDWINTGLSTTGYAMVLDGVLIDDSNQPLYPDIIGFLGASTTFGFKVQANVNDRNLSYLILTYTKTS